MKSCSQPAPEHRISFGLAPRRGSGLLYQPAVAVGRSKPTASRRSGRVELRRDGAVELGMGGDAEIRKANGTGAGSGRRGQILPAR